MTPFTPSLDTGLTALKQGDLGRAERLFSQILTVDPGNAEALHYLGCVALFAGDAAKAEKLIGKALTIRPKFPQALSNLGTLCRDRGRLDEAIGHFERALALDTASADTENNLGACLIDKGRIDDALQHLHRAMALDAAAAEIHKNLGTAYLQRGEPERALAALERAHGIEPDDFGTAVGLGRALRRLERPEEAEAAFRQALALRPENPEVLNGLGNVYRDLGRLADAADAYRRALAGKPGFAVAHNNLGSVLAALGRGDEARAAFSSALEVDPGNAEALFNLSRQPGADGARLAEAVAARLSAMEERDAATLSSLHFAAANLHHAGGEFDRAFEHYAAANEHWRRVLAGRGTTFDREAFRERIDALSAADAGGGVEQPVQGTPGAALFIVGMPRAGAMLVERIFARHPEAAGGGPLRLVGAAAQRLGHPKIADDADLSAEAAAYWAALRDLGGAARLVTDANPLNFQFLGLIARLLPDARIVHCTRDRRDTGLSCFRTRFESGHAWATSLTDIRLFQDGYERLMAHWKSRLGDRILDLAYEHLITDSEAEVRRLLDFTGLPWDDRCLMSGQASGPAAAAWDDPAPPTPDTSVVGAWRAYERHLAPLLG